MTYDNITFITNDGIVPAQFFPEASTRSGCQRLIMEIFNEAMDTLRTTHFIYNQSHGVRLWNDAVEWVLSDDERYASFVFCCHHLQVDPDVVREFLRKQYNLTTRLYVKKSWNGSGVRPT